MRTIATLTVMLAGCYGAGDMVSVDFTVTCTPRLAAGQSTEAARATLIAYRFDAHHREIAGTRFEVGDQPMRVVSGNAPALFAHVGYDLHRTDEGDDGAAFFCMIGMSAGADRYEGAGSASVTYTQAAAGSEGLPLMSMTVPISVELGLVSPP